MADLTRRAVLAGGLALAACRPSLPVKARADADPPGMSVEVDGVPIHLSRSGRGRRSA